MYKSHLSTRQAEKVFLSPKYFIKKFEKLVLQHWFIGLKIKKDSSRSGALLCQGIFLSSPGKSLGTLLESKVKNTNPFALNEESFSYFSVDELEN